MRHAPPTGSARFTVHASQVSVEVLGTQFNVWQRAEKTKVVLSSGKIKLKLEEQQATLEMRPGELVEVSGVTDRVVRKRVNPQVHTAWREKQIVFDHTTLQEIAAVIEDRHPYKVVVADSALLGRQFTFRLVNNDLDLLLRTLEKSLDLKITKQAETITIREAAR